MPTAQAFAGLTAAIPVIEPGVCDRYASRHAFDLAAWVGAAPAAPVAGSAKAVIAPAVMLTIMAARARLSLPGVPVIGCLPDSPLDRAISSRWRSPISRRIATFGHDQAGGRLAWAGAS